MAAIIQMGATMQCPHGGMVMATPSNSKVKVDGVFALLMSDTFIVAGCAFMVGTKPQPCLTVEWQSPATKFKVGGQQVLLDSSVGMCKSAEQIVQGTVSVSGVQSKAKGT